MLIGRKCGAYWSRCSVSEGRLKGSCGSTILGLRLQKPSLRQSMVILECSNHSLTPVSSKAIWPIPALFSKDKSQIHCSMRHLATLVVSRFGSNHGEKVTEIDQHIFVRKYYLSASKWALDNQNWFRELEKLMIFRYAHNTMKYEIGGVTNWIEPSR